MLIQFLKTGKIAEVTPNIAHGLVETKKAKILKSWPSYSDKMLYPEKKIKKGYKVK